MKLHEFAAIRLGEKNSRQVGREKLLKALKWVYFWGFSSPGVIDFLVAPGRRGFCAKLIRQGYLEEHMTPAGGGVKGVPWSLVTLTRMGVEEIEATLQNLIHYPANGSKLVNWNQIRHDVCIQKLTASAVSGGAIKRYVTPRMMAERSQYQHKQPDAVWVMPHDNEDKMVAVELELSRKKDREFDQAILAYIMGIRHESNERGSWWSVYIASTSDALIAQWKKRIQPKGSLPIWEKNKAGVWVKSPSRMPIPEYLVERMNFEKVVL